MFRQISPETANKAYAATSRAAALYAESAKCARRLAGILDGAFVSCKLETRIQAAFPSWQVHYYAASFSSDKYISFTEQDFDPEKDRHERRRFEIRLARKGQRRIDAADLLEQAKFCEQQAKKYAAALEIFWDRLGQYNVLVGSMDRLQQDISTVMYYADSFRF